MENGVGGFDYRLPLHLLEPGELKARFHWIAAGGTRISGRLFHSLKVIAPAMKGKGIL